MRPEYVCTIPPSHSHPPTVLQVSRCASALVNVEEDDGVLEGRWPLDGTFPDGKNPESWSGSAEILARFNPKKLPVRYGQCWVFAGVLTTGDHLTLLTYI